MTFPAGKHETSDFFATNYGCLPWKVRKFVPKKPDVFALKHGVFRRFSAFFGVFYAVFEEFYCKIP